MAKGISKGIKWHQRHRKSKRNRMASKSEAKGIGGCKGDEE